MSYEKQTWNKYDDLKTEEENIVNGAVVTDNRMNHIEEGIYSHTIDISNPHKVTAAQVGLGNVQNFGLATEDEAKQGISNAKYMTPSLTQAVLSANINSIAYANSADGTDGFTTVYPNLNLLDGTKDFSGDWGNSTAWDKNGTYKGLTVKKRTGQWQGIYKVFTAPKDGDYTFSAYIKASGATTSINRFRIVNGVKKTDFSIGSNFDWRIDTVTVSLKTGQTALFRYEIASNNADSILWTAGHKWEEGSTATPYMQSASEVTTADWPKYVGFSNTVKTNKSASDYTWFPVKDSELTNKVDSHINNKSNPHAVTASQVGAYSKTEADVKFATGQSLIDLSTTVEGKADNSAVVHKTGDETIGGKKTFTDDMTVKNISASGSLTSKIVSTKMESPAIKHIFVRTGNMVTLTTETKSGIAQTTAYDIPSGYRPFNDGTDPIYEQVLSGGKSAIIRSSVAKWQPRASAGLDAGLFGTISWPTKDNFPG